MVNLYGRPSVGVHPRQYHRAIKERSTEDAPAGLTEAVCERCSVEELTRKRKRQTLSRRSRKK